MGDWFLPQGEGLQGRAQRQQVLIAPIEHGGDVVRILSKKSVSAAGAAGGGRRPVARSWFWPRRRAPFTAAQADAGRAAYIANCMSCHQANLAGEGDALPLAGKTFIAAWRNRTTADLYNTIHTSMPYGNPGSLDRRRPTPIWSPSFCSPTAPQPGSTAFTPATAVKIATVASGTVPADIQRGIKPAAGGGCGPPAGGATDFGAAAAQRRQWRGHDPQLRPDHGRRHQELRAGDRRHADQSAGWRLADGPRQLCRLELQPAQADRRRQCP